MIPPPGIVHVVGEVIIVLLWLILLLRLRRSVVMIPPSSLPSSFLVSPDEFVATSCTLVMTIASLQVLNCWEFEAIFSIKFLASTGVMSPRAPPLEASIILRSVVLGPA